MRTLHPFRLFETLNVSSDTSNSIISQTPELLEFANSAIGIDVGCSPRKQKTKSITSLRDLRFSVLPASYRINSSIQRWRSGYSDKCDRRHQAWEETAED